MTPRWSPRQERHGGLLHRPDPAAVASHNHTTDTDQHIGVHQSTPQIQEAESTGGREETRQGQRGNGRYLRPLHALSVARHLPIVDRLLFTLDRSVDGALWCTHGEVFAAVTAEGRDAGFARRPRPPRRGCGLWTPAATRGTWHRFLAADRGGAPSSTAAAAALRPGRR
ncbi:MAG: hypothetical protein WAW17_20110 [Rhodococcus sp. (in: high G+C Gram-positive bacteria)]|uniref:hypothetical protein n=1 Tax=Rhodococcus sp. TaxID=1831 RepID=UPI003BB045B2